MSELTTRLTTAAQAAQALATELAALAALSTTYTEPSAPPAPTPPAPPAPTPPPPSPTPPPPAPTPPAPPPAPGDFAATKLNATPATDGSNPSATPGQSLYIGFSESGTTFAVARGDKYSVALSGALAADEPTANTQNFCVRNGSFPGITAQWFDRIDRPGNQQMESHYAGWAHSEANPGTGAIISQQPLNLYTHRRLPVFIQWVTTNYPQIDATKVVFGGGSMGAWGSLREGIHYPALCAAIFSSRPRWRSASTLGLMGFCDWSQQSEVRKPFADMPPLSAADGGGPSAPFFDLIAWVANPANKIPFVAWCCGKQEPYVPFADNIDAVAALRATKRPFAFSWNNGDHSTGDTINLLSNAYGYSVFKLGQGFPYLSGCSLDKDPAVDLVGTINGGFTVRNIVESAGAWSCEIKNAAACTVTVEPHSDVFTGTSTPQTISLAAGVWQTVSF